PLPMDTLEVIGTLGSIHLNGNVLTLSGLQRASITCDLTAAYQRSFDCAIAHFVACLRSGEVFETPAAQHLRILRLVEDAYTCARSDEEAGAVGTIGAE